MFKFDSDARAYLSASNALMEEIEDRGYPVTTSDWDALNTEWAARQAVLDAGAIGNYAEVVKANRTVALAVVVVAAVALTGVLVNKAYMVRVHRLENERREARRKARQARLANLAA
jgi:heme exporter protein D